MQTTISETLRERGFRPLAKQCRAPGVRGLINYSVDELLALREAWVDQLSTVPARRYGVAYIEALRQSITTANDELARRG